MSVPAPKYSFPRGKSTNRKQYVERALFFTVGLLFHAVPRCFQYLSINGSMMNLETFGPDGVLARNFSEFGYTNLPHSFFNASHRVLKSSAIVSKDTGKIACPLFSIPLYVPHIIFALYSWFTAASEFTQSISPESTLTSFICVIAALVGYQIFKEIVTGLRIKHFAQQNGCLPVKIMPNPFPWKLRRYWDLSKINVDLLDTYLFKKYSENGLTHGLGTVLTKRVKAISTIEPANFQAVLATRFDDWERPAFRAGAARPFLKTGILTLDGPHWAYSRKTMKSQFTRKQIDDNLAASERHLQDLFHAIGRINYDGWTDTIDFMDYFFRFAMDSSTEFLFGLSANTQLCAMVRKGKMQATSTTVSMDGFEEAFKRVQTHVGVRMKVGRSYWMVDGFAYRKACYDLGKIKDSFIAACIENAEERLRSNGNEPRNVIEALVVDGHDFDYISNQCRHLIIAGFETTSALLGFSFALIEQHPAVFKRLRAEVISWFGTEGMRRQPLNFENLKNCKYMQWVINETLRLYPAGPSIQRVAVRDTVLPRGGGPDGTSPIVVPKDSTIQLGIYLAHRRKDAWGEDANEFKPERWEGRKKGYDFIPFIAGPQICLGQQYSMTQAAYVIARFLMKYDAIEKPIGQDNLRKGWQTVLSPGNGVKLRMKLAEEDIVLGALNFPY